MFTHDFPPAEGAAYMDQQGQMFIPDTLLHTAMRATIYVAATPYVGTSDEHGRFTFEHVVPGPYKVSGFADGTPVDKTITSPATCRCQIALAFPYL